MEVARHPTERPNVGLRSSMPLEGVETRHEWRAGVPGACKASHSGFRADERLERLHHV